MQRFISLFLALCLSLTFSLEASAKRLGSGTSSGSAPMHQTQSRTTSSNDSPASAASPAGSYGQNSYGNSASTARSTPQPMQQPATMNRPSGMSRWLGPLAGLAAGGLLASMFMGDGFDGIQFFDILLLGLIAFGIFFLVRRMAGARRQDGLQPASGGLGKLGNPVNYEEPKIQPLRPGKEPALNTNIFGQPIDGVAGVRVADPEPQTSTARTFDAPAWFDEARFVEAGRKHFLELQQHWDAADMDRIATFVTPQMLEFLRKERAALGEGFQSTYIENLEVYLDGIEQQGGKTIATLSFEGVSKTSRFDQGEAFSESWRMERAEGDNQPWLVAGIRQN